MNTRDEIIQELSGGQSLTIRNLSDRLGKHAATITGQANRLLEAGYVSESNTRPATYTITTAGKEYFASDLFGQGTEPAKTGAASEALTIGYFTSGEPHISVGNKLVKLNRAQAAQLVEFVCALPSKMFSDSQRPTMASLPGRVVRAD